MNYPQDFIAAVKTEYPDETGFYNKLDKGDPELNFYLKAEGKMDTNHILQTLIAGKADELRAEAEKLHRRYILYLRWMSLKYPPAY